MSQSSKSFQMLSDVTTRQILEPVVQAQKSPSWWRTGLQLECMLLAFFNFSVIIFVLIKRIMSLQRNFSLMLNWADLLPVTKTRAHRAHTHAPCQYHPWPCLFLETSIWSLISCYSWTFLFPSEIHDHKCHKFCIRARSMLYSSSIMCSRLPRTARACTIDFMRY